MEHITQAEYARFRKVSRQAVNKAIKAGKIPVHGARKLIDPVEADRALGQNVLRLNSPSVDANDDTPAESSGASSELTKNRSDEAYYRARNAELDHLERIGKLLPIDDVTRSMERCAEAMVREIDRLPSRADDLAAALKHKGVPGLRSALKAVAKEIRDTLANNMRVLRDEGEEEEAE